MRALIETNPAYKAVTVMRVDWDRFSKAKIVDELRIPRRSTLVMFSGGKEVARVVAKTASDDIEALFKAVT